MVRDDHPVRVPSCAHAVHVHDRAFGFVGDAPSCAAEPPAEIDVFDVHEVAGIPSTHHVERGASPARSRRRRPSRHHGGTRVGVQLPVPAGERVARPDPPKAPCPAATSGTGCDAPRGTGCRRVRGRRGRRRQVGFAFQTLDERGAGAFLDDGCPSCRWRRRARRWPRRPVRGGGVADVGAVLDDRHVGPGPSERGDGSVGGRVVDDDQLGWRPGARVGVERPDDVEEGVRPRS